MVEHAPEPWKAETCLSTWIYDANDQVIVYELCGSKDEAADARRIVACVNACVDIETSDLEKMTPRFLVELLVKLGEIKPP